MVYVLHLYNFLAAQIEVKKKKEKKNNLEITYKITAAVWGTARTKDLSLVI